MNAPNAPRVNRPSRTRHWDSEGGSDQPCNRRWPGRYVGAEEVEDDGEPFDEKMPRLAAELNGQFAESAKLEAAIRANLKGLGYR